MARSQTALPTLFLIDCMSLVFQAFYAVRGNLTDAEGRPTNAIYGFTRQIQKFLSTYEPTHVVAVFDSKGPTFRHEMFPDYKANRVSPPEEFSVQLPRIFEVLEAMGIPQSSMTGFEADDLIGTLSRKASEAGMRTVIISADKDLFQLVDEHVSVLRSRKDDMEIYGPAEVKARIGVEPEQVADYLALVGDSSDNIPGVPGVGPKTAVALLEQFRSLDALYAGLDSLKGETQRARLAENEEKARLSLRLARIDRHVPLPIDLDDCKCHPTLGSPKLVDLYRQFRFNSLLREIETAAREADESETPGETSRKTDYRTVLDATALNRLVRGIRTAGSVAFDTETTSLDSMQADLVGISLCFKADTSYYIPVGHQLDGDRSRQLPTETVREALAPVLADPGIAKYAHNAKYDARILARHGMPVKGLTFDTMLASYLLDPEGSHGLKSLSWDILGIRMTEISELIGRGKTAVTMAEVEIDQAAPYACADADCTFQLVGVLGERLKSSGLTALFEEIEMPLVEVLDAMEAEGITVRREILQALSKEIAKKSASVAMDLFRIVGHEFNINSPKQVATVLFEEIGLKPRRKTATGLSTSIEVLEELRKSHPAPGLILEYRQLEKIKSTYADALPLMIHPVTGRIHTSYNQFIAATGRLSSSSPNLQNIPVRTALGRQIREAFIPNGADQVLLAADYSQIELRILAHVTGDESLRDAFVKNIDIHAQTAAKVFDMPMEMVTDEMRDRAKVINFGILYGMSAHRLSRELDIPHAQAQRLIDDYFRLYPKVRAWMDALLEEARTRGYVTTLTGRRRMIPGLKSSDRNQRANAERMAINMPIQGASADMIKIAMIRLHRDIIAHRRPARMVLQVHDELIFSLPEPEADRFGEVVRREMEEALPLSVPVRVDVKTGRTWAEC